MDILLTVVDFLLHVDVYLNQIVTHYGPWTYLILSLIIFCETGLVVTPFLPGDSLLFTIGALCGAGFLDIRLILVLLPLSAIAGDTANYWLGRRVGPAVFTRETSRLLNKAYLFRAQQFYDHHGGKTIIMARFVPIIRTFAPFVAGIGRMPYPRFMAYSVSGGLFWVGSLSGLGLAFGNMELVKKNFTLVIYLIILVSILPGVIELMRQRKAGAAREGK
jgi:membrane-associated protein